MSGKHTSGPNLLESHGRLCRGTAASQRHTTCPKLAHGTVKIMLDIYCRGQPCLCSRKATRLSHWTSEWSQQQTRVRRRTSKQAGQASPFSVAEIRRRITLLTRIEALSNDPSVNKSHSKSAGCLRTLALSTCCETWVPALLLPQQTTIPDSSNTYTFYNRRLKGN